MAMPLLFQSRKCTKEHMDEIELNNGQIFFLIDTKEIYIDTIYEGELQRLLVADAPSPEKVIKGTLQRMGWTQSYPFTYEYDVTGSGINKNTLLVVDLNVSPETDTGITQLQNWEKISKIETKIKNKKNLIVFQCYGDSRPVIDLPFVAREV